MRDRMDAMDERERKEEEEEEMEMRVMANRRAMSVACASVVRAASGVGLCAHELERATRTSPPSPLSREERGSQRSAPARRGGTRSGRGAEMQRLHEALDELEAAMERLRELYWDLPSAGRGM